jgi:hypothetical protein
MISLSPLSANSTPIAPPARGFRPLEGVPREIHVDFGWENLPGLSAAQKAGLRYEARAQLHLKEVLSGYCPSPIFEFLDDSGPRKCVPDGLYLPRNSSFGTFVFECKSQHMPEAFYQLRKLYQPVASAALAGRHVGVVEICRSFDPAMPFPEQVVLIPDIQEWVKEPQSRFGVYVWKP